MLLKNLLLTSVCASFFYFSTSFAGDDLTMTPPPPVKNQTLDGMVGSWKGESDMMGEKANDNVQISWTLDHQYLIMKLDSVSQKDPKKQYKGLGLIGLNKTGEVKIYWFDNWGAESVSTGTGKIEGNKLIFKDGNAMFKEQRSFTINGNQMQMQAKGTMNINGKDTPFEQAVTYKK